MVRGVLYVLKCCDVANPCRSHNIVSFSSAATPKSIQSLAYLLRNEILDNLNALRAELQYQLQQPPPSEEDNDVPTYVMAINTALQRYLEIVPERELQGARQLRSSRRD